MTEKRFTITDDGILDTVRLKQYTKIKSSDNILDSISFTHLIAIVNLLNELHEENEALKHQLQQQELEYATTCHRLAEENEQLKQQLIEKERMLDVRDKIIADVMKAVNGDVE